MRLPTALGLATISILAAGCGTSSTLSEYAGMPTDQLPPDHAQYRPRVASRSNPLPEATAQVTPAPLTPQEENARFLAFLQAENERLTKVTTICSRCGTSAAPPPPYDRAPNISVANETANTTEVYLPARIDQASHGQPTR